MKNTIQKPLELQVEKLPKNASSSDNVLTEKHKKANEFIKKVKLAF